MINKKFVSAVVVAAGSSVRMKSDISKQLLKINDKTVLEHTVSAFENSVVDEIVIVCPEKDIDSFKLLFANSVRSVPVKFTVGGSTRQMSVGNGVSAISGKCDIIAVHDGARPLVKPCDINRVIADSLIFGASALAVPVKDTIKIVEKDTVESTPPRDKLFIIQTPQAFCKDTYIKAYEKAVSAGLDFTDDCQLIESAGGHVHITIGDYKNIKITTPEDISVAEFFLKQR